ncbi:hypothetical protein ACFLUV_04140 [Elusimicrobiota bacterium]
MDNINILMNMMAVMLLTLLSLAVMATVKLKSVPVLQTGKYSFR